MAATTLFKLDRRSPGDGKPDVIYARIETLWPPRPVIITCALIRDTGAGLRRAGQRSGSA